MDEYIKRETAVKAANEWVSEACMASVMRVSRLFDKLQKVPAADVAPVVYCRECKRSGLTEFGKRYCSEPMGAFEGCIPVEDDSFCSGGKRREDAHAQD